MAVTIDTVTLPLTDAPQDVAALHSYWRCLRGDRTLPLRRDVDPIKLPQYIGFLCMLELQQEPLNLVYRLFGSGLVHSLQQDLTGQAVSNLLPPGLGPCLFRQLRRAVDSAAPHYFRTTVYQDNPPSDASASWLALPLSHDGTVVSRLLTYTSFETVEPEFWSQFSH